MKWYTVHNLQICVCVRVSFPNAGGHSDEEEEHLRKQRGKKHDFRTKV